MDTNIGFNTCLNNLKNDLVNTINKSNLPVGVLYYIVKDLFMDVQNAYEQAKQFVKATEVTSLAITKLDGTAKGGVVIGISHQLNVPVKYIGLGEKMTDLQPFNRRDFVDSLFTKK